MAAFFTMILTDNCFESGTCIRTKAGDILQGRARPAYIIKTFIRTFDYLKVIMCVPEGIWTNVCRLLS